MDPYRPPASRLSPGDEVHHHPSAFLLLALAGAHGVWLAFHLDSHPVEFRLAIMASLLGCFLLYAAALRFAMNSVQGTYLFFLSAAWSGAALFGRDWQMNADAPFMAGLGLALLGWWLVRRCQPG